MFMATVPSLRSTTVTEQKATRLKIGLPNQFGLLEIAKDGMNFS